MDDSKVDLYPIYLYMFHIYVNYKISTFSRQRKKNMQSHENKRYLNKSLRCECMSYRLAFTSLGPAYLCAQNYLECWTSF